MGSAYSSEAAAGFSCRSCHGSGELNDRHTAHILHEVCGSKCGALNPFRTAVPFGDKTPLNLAGLSPERDCGSKRVNVKLYFSHDQTTRPPEEGKKRAPCQCVETFHMSDRASTDRSYLQIDHHLDHLLQFLACRLERLRRIYTVQTQSA